ncbi:MAG: hypothetical protein HY876_08225 [Coriobacteriales bacterium]|nr:hypothetical protein [Coriobacteriales bacterium]
MYDSALVGERVANVHLLGIKYAAEIRSAGFTAGGIVRGSGLRRSYQLEVSTGMNLAKYAAPLPRFAD